MARRTTATANQGTAKPKPAPASPAPKLTQSAAANPAARSPAPPHDGVAHPPRTPRRDPTPEQIRQRAYEIYIARAGNNGSPDNDWLQAERELRSRG